MDNFYAKYSSSANSGVDSINGLTGALTLSAGTGISITPVGNVLTIAASATGANVTLSNLTSPTAINQHLIPAGNGTKNLGAAGNEWNEVRASVFINDGTGASQHILMQALDGDVNLQTNVGDITLTAAAGDIVLSGQKTMVGTEFMDFQSVNKIINLKDPTDLQDGATKFSAGSQTQAIGETNTVSDDTGIDVNTATLQLRTDGLGIWMHYTGQLTWDGSGVGVGPFLVTIPQGFLMDQSRIPGDVEPLTAAAAAVVGFCRWYDSGIGWLTGAVEAVDETTVKFTVTQTLLELSFAAGDGLGFIIDIPVVSPP